MNTSYHPVIEALEPRLAPAGVIAVSVNASGTLVLGTVAGLDGDEKVTIERLSDGNYRLTPDAGVQLRIGGANFNTAQVISGVTAGLTANLGAGDDVVRLTNAVFTKGVSINLGHGSNAFTMTDSNIAGALTYTGGDGVDVVTFAGAHASVGGATTLKLGGGADDVLGPVTKLIFNKGLTIDAGTGNDEIRLANAEASNLRVVGNLTVVGGAGDDLLALGATNTTVVVTGTLKLTDASGNETVQWAGTSVEAGSVSLLVGAGNNSLLSTATNVFVAKNLQWTSSTGTDNFDLRGTGLRVGGSVSVALGSGGGSAEIRPGSWLHVGGSLTMSGSGTGRDLEANANEIFIGGKVTMNAGTGDGVVQLFGFSGIYLGAGANLSSGAGDTNLGINGNYSFVSNGSVTISNSGLGSSSIFIGGFNHSTVIDGNVTLKGGASARIEMMGTITGSVNLSTNSLVAGSSLYLLSYLPTALQIGGAVKLNALTKSGQTAGIVVNYVLLDNSLNVLGGAGVETLSINNSIFNKAVTASLGAGNDVFQLERNNSGGASVYRGAVMLKGGAGQDSFALGGVTAADTVQFLQKVTVDGGTENDILILGANATFAPGLPVVTVSVP